MNYSDPQQQEYSGNQSGRMDFNRQIQKDEALLLSVLDSSLDIIQAFDAVRDDSGTIVDFIWKVQNKRSREQNGDVIGKSLLLHNPGVVSSGVFGRMIQVVETGAPSEEEQYYYQEQFNDKWFYQALVKQGDGITMTIRDITAQKKAQLDTESARNRLEAIINVSAIALAKLVAVRNPEGQITDFVYDWLNEAAIRISFDATHKSMLQSFPYTATSGLFDLMVKAAETGEMQQTELRYFSEGYDLWLYYKIAKLDDGVMFSCDNITDRRKNEQEVLDLKDQMAQKTKDQLKQSETLLASIFEASPIGLGFFDMNGEAVLLNDEMRRFLPTGAMPSRDKKDADRWLAFNPDGSRIEPQNYPGARALRGDPILPFLEMQYLGDSAAPVWARVSSVPFLDERGLVLGFISVITDINELKRTTEELRESEQQLKQLLKQKDEFISIASHELKTPVTSIKAYAQLVQANLERSGDLQNGDLLSRLNGQISRLINLINQLLDLTRAQEGKLELQLKDTDVRELLLERMEEIKPTTVSSLVLEAAHLPFIKIDRERIGQVVTNLLSNAIKYSSPGTQITVTAEALKEGIRISVRDRGEGISEKDQQKVFERFFRTTDGHTHLAPGMGLGLYISAQIIRRHGGTFSLESKKGEGSVFSFILPYENTGHPIM